MLDESLLKKICKKAGWLTQKDLNAHARAAAKKNKTLEAYLINENIINEDQLYEQAAKHLDLQFVNLKGMEIKKEILHLIPQQVAEKHNVIAFGKIGGELKVATLRPNDLQILEFIKKITGLKVKVFMPSPGGLHDCMRRFYTGWGEVEGIPGITVLQEKSTEEGAEQTPEDLEKAAQDLPIVNIVNTILEQAVFANASDIHIEPYTKEVQVRYRVDGVLSAVMTLPKAVQNGVVARVKILSNLRLDEHMLPQDGRFKIKVQDETLSFRVSIVPTMNGEKVVLRLLREGAKPVTLEELGLEEDVRKIVEANIQKPHGMILVTGPTGCGKTTTLYSILNILNQPSVNILTIEDPIEYHIKGISQSQVNVKAGFTFATALRSFLRQDPDIMMVGEIRDQETAEIAIHSAMTGHLVLSTLHTNDAPTTLPRLTDMNIPNFLVSFTVNLIIAQRLVRKLCEACRQEYVLPQNVHEEIERAFNTKHILDLYRKYKLVAAKDNSFGKLKFWKSVGCRKCGNTGYKGRIGIFEVLEVTDKIRDAINKEANAEQLKALAIEQGMMSMAEDGLVKAKIGITTLEEVFRATKE